MEGGWKGLTGKAQEETLWGDSNALGLDGGLITREYVFVKAQGISLGLVYLIACLGLVYLIACKFHLKEIKREKKEREKGKEEREGRNGGRKGGRETETINKH